MNMLNNTLLNTDKIDILIIPYRDIYFWEIYGSAVRDLQFVEVISDLNFFDTVYVLNRPVSIYERLTTKISAPPQYPNVEILDETSYNLIGPLKKRGWTEFCYNKHYIKFIKKYEYSNKKLIVLDFTPIAKIPISKNKNIFYWHDMIDNFTKHNRFSISEKNLVCRKYNYVAEHYDFLTAVSYEAARAIEIYNKIDSTIVPNGLFKTKFNDKLAPKKQTGKIYDLGFIGFITDKFDLEFVTELSKNFSVVIYGKILDQKIGLTLEKAGIKLMGGFSYNAIPDIMKTFKVGLIPYLHNKSHDGSPLKLYEYLKYNLPCITTIDYEFNCKYIINSNATNLIISEIKRLIKISGNAEISKSLPIDAHLKNNVEFLLKKILTIINK